LEDELMNKHPLSALPHDKPCAYGVFGKHRFTVKHDAEPCTCSCAELMARWDASEKRIAELESLCRYAIEELDTRVKHPRPRAVARKIIAALEKGK